MNRNDKAIADLNRIAGDIAGAGATIAHRGSKLVRKTAFDIEATAKQLCPVDTGATANSIYSAFDDSELAAAVGPTTEYAPYLEYGTSRMAPHAFMGPAFDRHIPDFVAAARQLGAEIL